MLMDSGVGVSTKTTFMCPCGLVVKFNLVHWFRDWLTSPWWTGFWPRLVLRKGVKFSSLSFFYLPFDIWLGFSPCGKDWIHAMTVSFMKKKQLLFWHGHFLEKDWLENIGKVFHLRSALILDYKFDSHCQASRQFCQVDWSIGLWVDTFYRHYFIPRVMPCFRMGAVAREKFAFLMGKEIFFLYLIYWNFGIRMIKISVWIDNSDPLLYRNKIKLR